MVTVEIRIKTFFVMGDLQKQQKNRTSLCQNVLSQKLRHQDAIFWLGKELGLKRTAMASLETKLCIRFWYMYLEKGTCLQQCKECSIQFFYSPSTTYFFVIQNTCKEMQKTIRIRMCRFLLTAKNDFRYTVFKIDLKKVYCTGPQEGLKIQGGASCLFVCNRGF